MKQERINYCSVTIGVCLALIFSSCILVPNSSTPRFYLLQAAHEKQVSKNNFTADMLIGVGPVKIPEYHNRPQIVTQNKEKLLKFAEFDRWGEPLELGIARLIREDLTVMLPGAKFTLYPWNSSVPVKYQLVGEIIHLDSELNKDLFIIMQWIVIDVQSAKTIIIKRSEFRQAILPQSYAGLAKTLSAACESLSSEIAEALIKLETNH